MADVIHSADQPVFWLLDITFAGRTIRVANGELDPVADDGSVYHYSDLIAEDIETEEAVSYGGGNAGQISVPIRTFFDLPEGVAQLVAEGHVLAGCRCELSRWVWGTPWNERRVVVVGTMSSPEYGDDSEPVSFSITSVLAEGTGLTGSPSQIVTGATWAHADTLLTEHLGVAYPVVFGKPGVVAAGVDDEGHITATVGCWIDRRDLLVAGNTTSIRLLVCHGHCEAETVWLSTDEYPPGYEFFVRHGYDELGQPVSFVPWFATAAAGAPEDDYDAAYLPYSYATGSVHALGDPSIDGSFNANGDTVQNYVYVSWHNGQGGAQVRHASDVIAMVLGYSSLDVDLGRIQATRGALDRFELDGAIETRVKPWNWIREKVIPLLPVSLDSGPSGLFWHVWPQDLTAADATIHLDADTDPDVERVGPINEDAADVINRITLQYAWARRTQNYCGTVTLGATEDLVTDDDRVRDHPALTLSRGRYGLRELSLSSDIVYSDSTAWAIVESIAATRGLPWPTVSYILPEAPYIRIGRMSFVTLTDSAVALAQRPAIVTGLRTTGDGLLEVTLSLRPVARKATR